MEVGQRVHCTLYGGKDGVVEAVHGVPSPETCRSIGGIGVTGGNAQVDIIWDNGTVSKRVSECLVRCSVQWRILDEAWSASQVEEARVRAAEYKLRMQREAEEKAAALQRACAELRVSHPTLVTAEKEPDAEKRAMANIRALLKRNWPKVKFSVTNSRGSARIAWMDGPSSKQVEAAVQKFEAGHFDGMEDIYRHQESAWTLTFGGLRYVHTVRKYSDIVIRRAVDALWACLPNMREVEKPVEVDERFCWTPHGAVPGLSRITVEELVQCLASHYDAVSGAFQMPEVRYGRLTFIVEIVCEAEMALAA